MTVAFAAGQRIKASYLNQGVQLIQSQVLAATTASVSFSAIPTTYNHLELRWHGRTTSGNTSDNLIMRINGDSGPNYDWELLAGLNTTASATPSLGDSKLLLGTLVGGTGTAGFFSNGTVDIQGWSQSGASHVVTVSGKWYACWSNSAATSQTGAMGGLYTPSSAATSLTLTPAAGSFAAGSVFSLYGWN